MEGENTRKPVMQEVQRSHILFGARLKVVDWKVHFSLKISWKVFLTGLIWLVWGVDEKGNLKISSVRRALKMSAVF